MASKDSDTRKSAKTTGRPDTRGTKPSDPATKRARSKRTEDDTTRTSTSSETDSVIVRPPGTTY
jgi:hypothetical protein